MVEILYRKQNLCPLFTVVKCNQASVSELGTGIEPSGQKQRSKTVTYFDNWVD